MLSNNINEYTNFLGKSGLYWFIGRVIDRQDPLKIGRVRVRIYGIHSNDLNLIDYDQLRWCMVMGSINDPATSGFGKSPVGLVPGSVVIGLFLDHDHMQEGLVIGSLYGLPTQNAKSTLPFGDPRDTDKLIEKLASAPRKVATYSYAYDGSGVTFSPESQGQNYPRENNRNDTVLSDGNDLSLLSTGDNLQKTIIGIKKNSRDMNVQSAFGIQWSEPEVLDNPIYPYNLVYQSESGTYSEYDSTPNAERTSFFDRSGSWWSYNTDGTFVEKFGQDKYSINCKDEYLHNCGTKNETIGKDSNEFVEGSKNVEVTQDLKITVHQNGNIVIEGDANITIDGNVIMNVSGDVNAMVNGKLTATANEIDLKANGDINLTAGGNLNFKGTKINLN